MNISANTAWLWSRIFFFSFCLTSNVHCNRHYADFIWSFNHQFLWYEFNWKSSPLCYSPRNITDVHLPRNTVLMFMFQPRLILIWFNWVVITMLIPRTSRRLREQQQQHGNCNQCDFRFDLFFSFSFSFASYQTCWRRSVDDLPK